MWRFDGDSFCTLPFAVVGSFDGGGVATGPCQWFTQDQSKANASGHKEFDISTSVKDKHLPTTDCSQFRVQVWGKAGKIPVKKKKALWLLCVCGRKLYPQKNLR